MSSSFASSTPATSSEGDLVLRLGIEPRPALTEGHRLVAGALDLPDHEEPDEPEEEEPWQKLEEPLQKEVVVGFLALHLDAVGDEHPDELRILVGDDRLVLHCLVVFKEDTGYFLAVDDHGRAHAGFLDHPDELAVLQLLRPGF